jgi:hypothetical protein
VYVIAVTWDTASWTVYRRYQQFSDFNNQAKKAGYTFAYALPGKKLQGNLKDQFIEHRQVHANVEFSLPGAGGPNPDRLRRESCTSICRL